MATPEKRSRPARTRGTDLDKPKNRKDTRINRMRGRDDVIELVVVPKRRRVRGSFLDDFTDERLEVITALTANGATDYELATAMGISVATLWRWAASNDKLRSALTLGKDALDDRVARMLATKALGYTYNSEKVAINADGMVTRTPIVEHVAPDTTAMIFWLKNRRPEEWRDVKNVAMEGELGVRTDEPTDRQLAMAIVNMLREATNAVQGDEPVTIDHLVGEDEEEDRPAIGFGRRAARS